MTNQTALPSLTVNPSNVLPSLPPSLSPPPLLSPPSLLPSLSPPFTLGRTHPRSAEAGRGAPTPSRRATHSSSHGHHKRSTRDPPGRTGRRLDGGAGGGWQEQGFGVTANLTRSRGERPWEAMGTTSIARIGKESSTTTGTLIIIIIIAPLVFGPGGSLGSPVPRGERTLEGSLVDVERNGLQNTQAQYRTSLKPCGGSFGHAAYLNRYRRGSEVLWTRRRPPSLPSR